MIFISQFSLEKAKLFAHNALAREKLKRPMVYPVSEEIYITFGDNAPLICNHCPLLFCTNERELGQHEESAPSRYVPPAKTILHASLPPVNWTLKLAGAPTKKVFVPRAYALDIATCTYVNAS